MTAGVLSRKERIEAFLAEGRSAARAGQWVAAANLWIEAAKLGDPQGWNLVSRTAAPQIKLVADAGDVEAQALLAGVLMDYFDASALPMALEYARMAAAAGHAKGLRTLGFMFKNGLGVERDVRQAAELWHQACTAGDGYAAFNLAALHIRGESALDSEQECMRLLALAAERGVVEAGAALGDRLAAADRDEEALTWLLWAAERGHVRAMFAAGCWYRDGVGTPVDGVQAVRWYLTMLDHGNGDGVHEAIQLAKAGMTASQIREAARLAGQEAFGEGLIDT